MDLDDYAEYKIAKEGPLGKNIKQIISQSNDCIVYLDIDDEIQWATINFANYHENFGDIQNKIYFWESTANRLFSKQEAFDYKCLIASAFSRILEDKNELFANQIIERTTHRMTKHAIEILKQDYLLAALKYTVLVLVSLTILLLIKNYLLNYITQDAYHILVTILFGGIGAFIFAILRLKNYTPDISIGREIHKIDGALRIFYGLIFGLVVAIGIKSNVVLGFVNKLEMTIYLKAFLGIVAGASEILVPNLIKQVEEKSSH